MSAIPQELHTTARSPPSDLLRDAGPDRPALRPAAVAAQAVAYAALALATYGAAAGHGFLVSHDDRLYVVQNPFVKALTWENVRAIFTTVFAGNYAPLHVLSYALDHALWGDRFAPYVLEDVLLHATNALLLSLLLFHLHRRASWGFVAGLVFLLHPVQVESVVWVSERKNVLAMAFSLLALHAYLSYRDARPRRGGLAYAAALAAFVCALLTKAVAIVLVPVLVLLDRTDAREEVRRRWLRDVLPFAAIAALFAALTISTQGAESGGGRASFHGGGPLATFLTVLTVLPRYLGLLLWPGGLSAMYDPPVHAAADAAVLASAALWLALVAVGVALRSRAPRLFLWYATFFVGLLPVSQLVPLVTLMNDRYLYFPMLGVAGLVGALGPLVAAQPAPRRHAVALCGAALLAALAWTARARVDVWRDDVTLWSDTAPRVPRFTHGWYNLGRALQDAGRDGEALGAFGRVLDILPTHRDALMNAGALHLAHGRPASALPLLLRAVAAAPDSCGARLNLASAWLGLGEDAQAVAALEETLVRCPGAAAPAHAALAQILWRQGRRELAEAHALAAQRAGASPTAGAR